MGVKERFQMKIILTLEVDYDIDGNDEAKALYELQDILHNSVDRMVGSGGLSGETTHLPDEWSVRTHLVEE